MIGSWRPIIAPSTWSGNCVTAASVVTGAPSAPNATATIIPIAIMMVSPAVRKYSRVVKTCELSA